MHEWSTFLYNTDVRHTENHTRSRTPLGEPDSAQRMDSELWAMLFTEMVTIHAPTFEATRNPSSCGETKCFKAEAKLKTSEPLPKLLLSSLCKVNIKRYKKDSKKLLVASGY